MNLNPHLPQSLATISIVSATLYYSVKFTWLIGKSRQIQAAKLVARTNRQTSRQHTIDPLPGSDN